jgi:hypothetical protein
MFVHLRDRMNTPDFRQSRRNGHIVTSTQLITAAGTVTAAATAANRLVSVTADVALRDPRTTSPECARMQHGDEAGPSAKMLGIGPDDKHRFGGGLEQQIVDDGLVLIGEVRDLRRQSKHLMKVRNRQQLGLAGGEPLPRRSPLTLRAVPVAAANGRRPLAALWAKSVMGSWRLQPCNTKHVSASRSHHYEVLLSMAISLSGARKEPRRRCGGTMDSIASSFSVGSPRV